MFALVQENQVIRTTAEQSLEWQGFTYSNVYLLTPEERKAVGIFDFIAGTPNAPEGQKAQGTTIEIGDGVVIETPLYIDKSAEEIAAELDANRVVLVVSRFQGMAALSLMGRTADTSYLQEVNTYMLTADPMEQLAWATIQEFREDSPLLLKLAALLGMTAVMVRDLFIFALTIQA